MVTDFRQPSGNAAKATRTGGTAGEPQSRVVVIYGIVLSAILMAAMGTGLLLFEQPFIPAQDATLVAVLFFATAAVDLALAGYLKLKAGKKS